MPRKSRSRSKKSRRSRSRSPKMSIGTGYCVKCKAKRKIENPKKRRTRNGRNMVCGTCGVCETKVCRFIAA